MKTTPTEERLPQDCHKRAIALATHDLNGAALAVGTFVLGSAAALAAVGAVVSLAKFFIE